MYEMRSEYLTGIEFIDKEHTRLFEIAEETYQLKKNEFLIDKYDQVSSLLQELRDYTKTHFQHEEEYMQSIGYKRMFTQKVEHNAFIQKLEDMDMENLDENSDEMIDEILKFLTDWLVEHIMENDKLIAVQ